MQSTCLCHQYLSKLDTRCDTSITHSHIQRAWCESRLCVRRVLELGCWKKGVVVTASCEIGEGVRTQQAMKTKMKLGRLLNRFAPRYLMWREKTFPKIWALLRKFAVLPWRWSILATLTVVEKFFCLLCNVDSLVESQGLLIKGGIFSSVTKTNLFFNIPHDWEWKTKQGGNNLATSN